MSLVNVKLQKFSHVEFSGDPREWRLPLIEFKKSNLIVGRNASGKSRILNIIHNLSQLIAGRRSLEFESGESTIFLLATKDDGKKVNCRYHLSWRSALVVQENFTYSGKPYLRRGHGGFGEIFSEQVEKMIKFQTPDNQLAVVYRQDSIQHSFFEPIITWAKSVHFYPFSSYMGKNTAVIQVPESGNKVDPYDFQQVVGLFRDGSVNYGSDFVASVISGMGAVGYSISDIFIDQISGVIHNEITPHMSQIYVQEVDLACRTSQIDMSVGMFRALSMVIHIEYGFFAKIPTCIIVDDIGEGLDFERATNLIKYVTTRASQSRSQLIMSTNDRFVMNSVPLDYWSVIDRRASEVFILNSKNSKEVFENFHFTGLSNFDFFSRGLYTDSSSANI